MFFSWCEKNLYQEQMRYCWKLKKNSGIQEWKQCCFRKQIRRKWDQSERLSERVRKMLVLHNLEQLILQMFSLQIFPILACTNSAQWCYLPVFGKDSNFTRLIIAFYTMTVCFWRESPTDRPGKQRILIQKHTTSRSYWNDSGWSFLSYHCMKTQQKILQLKGIFSRGRIRHRSLLDRPQKKLNYFFSPTHWTLF